MSTNLESILASVRQLPWAQQQQLAAQILAAEEKKLSPAEIQAALARVEQTRGLFSGLDRETVIRLAEDDEFCGYPVEEEDGH